MQQGKIYKLLAGTYYIDMGDRHIQAKAKGSFRKDGLSPKVGDKVMIEGESGAYRIRQVLPRFNDLNRPQVANIDNLVIVLSPQYPSPDLLLVDRLIFSARRNGVTPIVVINKSELDAAGAENIRAQYAEAGLKVQCVSFANGDGLEELKALLLNATSCFAGQSAVGKSSLISYFMPDCELQTGGLSKKTDRGKHTTRHCELYMFAPNSYVADTPGFSLLDQDEIEPDQFVMLYDDTYSSISENCRFRGCTHTSEPDCAVKTAVEQGTLSADRYARYCELYKQIKEQWRNRYD